MTNQARKLKNLKFIVKETLARFPETRNDDITLQFYIIRRFMPDETAKKDGKIWISIPALKDIREDHIKRIRAYWQNDKNLYLPTDPAVRKQRRISEEAWLEALNKNPEMISPEKIIKIPIIINQ